MSVDKKKDKEIISEKHYSKERKNYIKEYSLEKTKQSYLNINLKYMNINNLVNTMCNNLQIIPAKSNSKKNKI
jgi:hypothetical protein